MTGFDFADTELSLYVKLTLFTSYHQFLSQRRATLKTHRWLHWYFVIVPSDTAELVGVLFADFPQQDSKICSMKCVFLF